MIGGLGRVEGAWIGALAFIVINNYIRDSWLTEVLDTVRIGGSFNTIIGLVFLLIVVLSPDGLMGLWDRAWSTVRRPRGGSGPRWRDPSSKADQRRDRSDVSCKSSTMATRQLQPRRRKAYEPSLAEMEAHSPARCARDRCLGCRIDVVCGVGCGAGEIRVAIMTDCKGAFGFGYEIDIGGAQAALAQYAGGKVKNPKKPSAGMTGIKAGGKDVRIVGYGCGDDTVPTAVKETRRLMEQLRADVMIGPLSGDEAVVRRAVREVASDEDVHHRHRRLAGSDAAARTAERVPLPR